MLYLLLSILSSTMISIFMRLSEGKIKSNLSMLAVNYLTCLTASWALTGFGDPFPASSGLIPTLGMGTFNGFFYMLSLVIYQHNIAINGVILPSVFSRIGALLIPLFVSILIFGEAPTVIQIIGAVLAVISIFALNYRKDTGSNKNMLFLLALLVTEGCACIMSKVFSEIGDPSLDSNFLLYTFLTAFLFCVAVILVKRERPGCSELLYGIMVGLPNFLSARFMLKALTSLPAVVVYPTRSVATIVMISLAGLLFFHEKLSKRQLAAMAVILVSLIMLNI